MMQPILATAPRAGVRYLLPPEAYLSQDWYRREQELLFGRTWHLAGHECELEGEGKQLVVRAGRTRVIVQRDDDGVLGAHHNPWLELSGRPVDPSSAGLKPVRVDTWERLIWVSADPDAPALGEWLGEFGRSIEGFRPHLLDLAGRSSIEVQFNWKLFIENHIDVLHLWYLHANSLKSEHNKFEWHNPGPHWVSYEPLRPDADRKPRFDKPISHVQGTRAPLGINASLIFPNIVFGAGRDSMNFTTVRPLAPDRCVFESVTLCEPGAVSTRQGDTLRRRTIGGVMDEDLTACEGMQALMRSSRFAVGPLATRHEQPIMRFQRDLLSYLEPADATRSTDQADATSLTGSISAAR